MAQNFTFGFLKGLRFISRGIFVMTVVLTMMGLSARESWAASASYEEIRELEKTENIPPAPRIERPVVQYLSGHLKDPFLRIGNALRTGGTQGGLATESVKERKPLPPLEIQGIVWGGIFPQAIVNNKVVKVGENIKVEDAQEEIRVISIDKEGITVSFDGQDYQLSAPAGGGTIPNIPSGG